jgi:hypothetical protein
MPMTKIFALVALLALTDGATSLTSTRNMALQGGHVVPVALVLAQDGTVVTGTIAMPTQHFGDRKEVELKGELIGRELNLAGAVDGAADPTTIEIAGTLLDDGTLEGTVEMKAKETHSMRWTAERLKERTNAYHVGMVSYVLDELRKTPDADGTMGALSL